MNFSISNPGKSLFRKLASSQSRFQPATFNRNDQIVYLTLTALAGASLVVGRILKPSPTGFGTHEQLGLPPCLFFKLTGFPCPGCGVTTSFAHSAHLHFAQAFITQPFGVVVFSLMVISIPLFLVLLRRRVAWMAILYAKGFDWLVYFLIVACLLSWMYKIAAIKWLVS